jgi:RNA polymerase sigma-70 factor (ECF subfamily)
MEKEPKVYEKSGDNLKENDPRLGELNDAIKEKYNFLMGIAFKFVKSKHDAEDLVQTTFLKAWKSLKTYNPGTNINAWLARILANNAINHIRKTNKAYFVSLTDDESGEEIQTEEIQVQDYEDFQFTTSEKGELTDEEFNDFGIKNFSDEIFEILDSMNRSFRNTVLMCDVFGLSYIKIAEITDTAIGTVMSRIHRARYMLRETVGDFGLAEYGIEITNNAGRVVKKTLESEDQF